MAATKMFFITWFSSSTHLKIDLSILDMFFRSGFGYAGFSDLEDVWDDLPVSRLKYNALDDFQEVFQTSGLPGSRLTESSLMSLPFITDLSVLVFNQKVLIFHSFKGFLDLDLICRFFRSGFDMQVFQIWKTSGTTYLLIV
ncbi:hypothetical protein F2Q69_00048925 [Brassica cretica]|uniref:Uncharacterized protein n=1 Tax=Brassica cretica TaxID=69181 RepID=A0A8S9PWU5_BRACR|nr:hypothetical protein F2Q69_00048925 [Brassica cretica]